MAARKVSPLNDKDPSDASNLNFTIPMSPAFSTDECACVKTERDDVMVVES